MVPELTPVVTSQSRTPTPVWLLSGRLCEGESIRQIAINSPLFRIGRRSDTNLCLPSSAVSKLHAEIVAIDDSLYLRDMGSTNGTWLNGNRIQHDVPVGEGDLVQFADIVFRITRHSPDDCGRTHSGNLSSWSSVLSNFECLLNDDAVIPYFQPILRFRDYSTDPLAADTESLATVKLAANDHSDPEPPVEAEIVGYEVLARSNFPGMASAGEMFSTAARLDLEAELSVACRIAGVRIGEALPSSLELFLNTHPSEDLTDGTYASLRALRNLAPDQPLTIEIHEAAVTNLKQMGELRALLRDLNIKLAYDDFGAGQARLLELINIPPDYLKFDIRMIRSLHLASTQHQQLVGALVRMVKDFGITPLAEGVERREEAECCRHLGFELVQGHYYGKPAPIERILEASKA